MMYCLLYRGSYIDVPGEPFLRFPGDSKSATFEITFSDRNHTDDAYAAVFSSILVQELLNDRVILQLPFATSLLPVNSKPRLADARNRRAFGVRGNCHPNVTLSTRTSALKQQT